MAPVLLTKTGHTALITLNAPETMNVLNVSMMEAIDRVLDEILLDSEVYTVVITGSGRSFIAGADIREMLSLTMEELRDWSAIGERLNAKIEAYPLPVIAAVNGYALGGGCELAISCDMIVASKAAKFGLPETTLGVICGAGGTQRLPRLIGRHRAQELLMTGERISAQRAEAMGLVNRVVEEDELLPVCFALCERINRNGPIAVRAVKRAVNIAMTEPLPEGLLQERELFLECSATDDRREGFTAFLEKRESHFSNG